MGREKRVRTISPEERARKVRIFKLVDAIVQGLLFVLFIFNIDTDPDIPYRLILYILICWQVLSSIANYVIHHRTRIKKKRILYLVSISVYLLLFLFFGLHLNQQVIKPPTPGELPTLPFKEIAFIGCGLAICFWYNVTCVFEIQKLQKRIDDGKI